MSIAARHHRTAPKLTDAQLHATILRRVVRILTAIAVIAGAIGAAWAGIVFREYVDRIIVTTIATIVVPFAIYQVVRFFRDPDD